MCFVDYDPGVLAMQTETMTEDRIPNPSDSTFITRKFSVDEFSHTNLQSARRATATGGVLNGERMT